MRTSSSGRFGPAAAAATYRNAQVMAASAVELVVLLYERLLADLEGAALAMRSGDLTTKAQRLQRATDVLFELLASLDHERGGEVSQRLAALYGYMISRLADASRTRDASILEELSRHASALLSAWRSVAAQAGEAAPSDGAHVPTPR